MISALVAVLLVFLICVYTRTAARGDEESVRKTKKTKYKLANNCQITLFQTNQQLKNVAGLKIFSPQKNMHVKKKTLLQ